MSHFPDTLPPAAPALATAKAGQGTHLLCEWYGCDLDVSRTYLRAIHHGALTNPGGPSQPLYTAGFYSLCAARLNSGGLLSLQVASPFSQPERVVSVLNALSQAFAIVRPYMVSIPLSGGQWMMTSASQTLDPVTLGVAQTDSVILQRGLMRLQHYNGNTHQAAMALPNFVRHLVAKTPARWQSS
jgi:hypothetical protein